MKNVVLLLVPLYSGCLVNTGLHAEQRQRFDCLDRALEVHEERYGPLVDAGLDAPAPPTIDDISPAGTHPDCTDIPRTWFADCDADGLGDPGQSAVTTSPETPLDAPECPGESGGWSFNDRDCDDSEPGHTRTGPCPDTFADGWLETRAGEQDLLLAVRDTPLGVQEAASLCATWAPDGALALLDSEFERGQVANAWADHRGVGPILPGEPVMAFVDAALQADGEWRWTTGDATGFPYCGSVPPTLDALPDPVQQEADALRLVLSVESGSASSACLRLSEQPRLGHAFVCERTRPGSF